MKKQDRPRVTVVSGESPSCSAEHYLVNPPKLQQDRCENCEAVERELDAACQNWDVNRRAVKVLKAEVARLKHERDEYRDLADARHVHVCNENCQHELEEIVEDLQDRLQSALSTLEDLRTSVIALLGPAKLVPGQDRLSVDRDEARALFRSVLGRTSKPRT